MFSFLALHHPSTALLQENHFENCHAPIAGALHWDWNKPKLVNNTFLNVTASVYGDILGSYPAMVSFVSEKFYLENLEVVSQSPSQSLLSSTL